jgi:hypothetical protein
MVSHLRWNRRGYCPTSGHWRSSPHSGEREHTNNERRSLDCQSALGPRIFEVVLYCRSPGRHVVLQCILESFAGAAGCRATGRVVRTHLGYWILRWHLRLLALELPGAAESRANTRPDSKKRCSDYLPARCQLFSRAGHGLAEFHSRTHGNGAVGWQAAFHSGLARLGCVSGADNFRASVSSHVSGFKSCFGFFPGGSHREFHDA